MFLRFNRKARIPAILPMFFFNVTKIQNGQGGEAKTQPGQQAVGKLAMRNHQRVWRKLGDGLSHGLGQPRGFGRVGQRHHLRQRRKSLA